MPPASSLCSYWNLYLVSLVLECNFNFVGASSASCLLLWCGTTRCVFRTIFLLLQMRLPTGWSTKNRQRSSVPKMCWLQASVLHAFLVTVQWPTGWTGVENASDSIQAPPRNIWRGLPVSAWTSSSHVAALPGLFSCISLQWKLKTVFREKFISPPNLMTIHIYKIIVLILKISTLLISQLVLKIQLVPYCSLEQWGKPLHKSSQMTDG